LHGYALTQQIQRGSAELLRVEEGSVYPALHRMAQAGWIKGKWGMTERNRPARVYVLTALGAAQLEVERENWARLTRGVNRVLRLA
jgi:transcriptional regulator